MTQAAISAASCARDHGHSNGHPAKAADVTITDVRDLLIDLIILAREQGWDADQLLLDAHEVAEWEARDGRSVHVAH